jgi:hypothetical protein
MNRAERRNRTEKIAKKRFRSLYCNHHGTPEKWFFRVYDETEQARNYGRCRDRIYSWRCRCEWCRGGMIVKQDIADFEYMEGLSEALDLDTRILQPIYRTRGVTNDSALDADHEYWWMFVKPYHYRADNGKSKHHH